MSDSAAPALKEWFNADRFRWIAAQLAELSPAFDADRFLRLSLRDLPSLSLLQRMRRASESIHACLPLDYPSALAVLRQLAPRFQHNFVSIVLPDFVGLYGHDHFEESMEALAFFTCFGSSEFAIREFLRRDLTRTLAVMRTWADHDNEHIRRLACEGCRPRLPWSFQLAPIVQDPSLTWPILAKLHNDPSLYVRKSVANHGNDFSKDHPDWLIARLATWDLRQPHTAWIARRATRTLIKAGHPGAFALFGLSTRTAAHIDEISITPRKAKLGDRLRIQFSLTSTSKKPQALVLDYAVHYVKKSGQTSRKVFKLTELTLPPLACVPIEKTQVIRDFSTRKHYAGLHRIDLLLNGLVVATGQFTLSI